MQRATRRVRFLREGQPDLPPTVRYVIRYAVREAAPGQLPPHLSGLPAEPAWALVKETTEVLPEGQRRLWVQELQPSQLQRVLQSQPIFQPDFNPRPADAAAPAGGGNSTRAHQHETGGPVYRGAAALERAVQKAKESTEQAIAAVRQAERAAAAAATACIVAIATAGVAAGAAAAAKARVTNMPPYTLEARVPDESLARVPRA
ncbi:hypothetical protein ACSSS7_007196 [Eimeria intestinalis]